ncbi:MAG: DinB family protein [Ktedonobacteraceae bacterium]|nr:DinB family protein [Ktedonobacteraceae bacterium]
MPAATPEQIREYEAGADHIKAAIDGLSERRLLFTPVEGEWSIHEVVLHLADGEIVWSERVRKALAEPGSALAAYNEETWAKNLAYQQQDRTLALNLFAALRASNAALFRSLSEEEWDRTGLHEERGVITVYTMFQLILDHVRIHLQQIEELKRNAVE